MMRSEVRTATLLQVLKLRATYGACTVAEIIKHAGISESTFRRHFNGGICEVYEEALKYASNLLCTEYMVQVPKQATVSEIVAHCLYVIDASCRSETGVLADAVAVLFHDEPNRIVLAADLADVHFIDSALANAFPDTQAKALACIIHGTIGSYVRSFRPNTSSITEIVALIKTLLHQSQDSVPVHTLKEEGIVRSKLQQMHDDLQVACGALGRVLSQ